MNEHLRERDVRGSDLVVNCFLSVYVCKWQDACLTAAVFFFAYLEMISKMGISFSA
jgi:hypothetical protein